MIVVSLGKSTGDYVWGLGLWRMEFGSARRVWRGGVGRTLALVLVLVGLARGILGGECGFEMFSSGDGVFDEVLIYSMLCESSIDMFRRLYDANDINIKSQYPISNISYKPTPKPTNDLTQPTAKSLIRCLRPKQDPYILTSLKTCIDNPTLSYFPLCQYFRSARMIFVLSADVRRVR
ncbi:hypothetical protein BDV97DRAFT_79627 [Delphinella strobiligena]|nr:hypothetical protein BDV97DRAFT_79627 [Delphinella strobiligena]